MAHESTSAQLAALYPLLSSEPLPIGQVLIGRDLYGGLFAHDPFELYRCGVLTNPNMVVLGQIGRGKSSLVKTYLYRQVAFGRRFVVLDPKGEYGPLAEGLGLQPIRLEPGGALRVNPLDLTGGPGAEAPEELNRSRLSRLVAIAGACAGRLLTALEHSALECACASLAGTRTPDMPAVVRALLDPDPASARAVGASVAELQGGARDLALELRRFVLGELRGMFDGPTSPSIDWSARGLVFDLSALYESPALPVVLACAAAALERVLRPGASQLLLVIDEAWAVLSNLAAARFFQSSFKLARARGVANIAVVHRLSDLAAAGSAGTATERLAEGLLRDCETTVCYAQPESEVPALVDLLGLDEQLARRVTRLGRGVGLWRVGRRSFLVEHRLSALERRLVDTDAAMGALRHVGS